jgi:site-specific DNA-cytosine methylase
VILKPFRYGSVCSGIEATTVAWHPLRWKPAFFSEIEKFPRAVLQHHYPDVPLHGDFTTIKGDEYGPIDLLVGGTPCQDNSIGYSAGAGKAGDGFDGARSSLAWQFVDLADRSNARILVWENVPNVLSKRHAPSFLRFVNLIAERGYGYAWRVLDGRHFGATDQPRPRIFVVAHRGGVGTAAKILFESESTQWDRKQKTSAAPVLTCKGGVALDDRTPCVLGKFGPRRSTPLEWERAMGFPDGHTAIPGAVDGKRYNALGNSMDVHVMRWIGRRITEVEASAPGPDRRPACGV